MDKLNEALRAIETQQKEAKEHSPQWMVGEQLKDICREDPACAELIVQDLAVKEMSITAAEKKLKAYADKHKTGNFSCVPPVESDCILREFYGLPKRGGAIPAAPAAPAKKESGVIDLSEFL